MKTNFFFANMYSFEQKIYKEKKCFDFCSKFFKRNHWTFLTNRNKQDSKELRLRSLNKMLLKLQVNSQAVQSTQLSKFFKFSKSSKFWKCSKFKDSKFKTCLNLFRIIRWRNTLRFEQMAQRKFDDKVIPWIASSKSTDQKSVICVKMCCMVAWLLDTF